MTRPFLLLLALILSAAAQPRVDAIRAHMNFLASDLLEGRGTGTRGYQIAAEYVAAQYALAGLEPGAGKSWYQTIPFRQTVARDDSSIVLTRDGVAPLSLRIFDTFSSQGDPLHAEKVVDGEVVFGGFGVTAPDQKYDDFANVDVRGKIVAIFRGAPKRFPNAVRAHYSSTYTKYENLVAHGAKGLIFLTSPSDAEKVPWAHGVRRDRLGSMHWQRGDGTLQSVFPEVSHAVTFSLDSTRILLGSDAQAVFDGVEKGEPRSRVLPLRARIRLTSKHEGITSPNVVGLLRGSDPKLRDEHLVYTSHLDHLGITEPVNGDAINNGALDNASGIASMLETARLLAAQRERPRRSILFVATTAEERGLRGADYFANNPTVPAERIVANINVDMILMAHRTRDLIALGAETSDLGDLAKTVAREMKIELSPDPFPDEVFFVRSDQYPFIRRGIPAIYLDAGYKAVEPGVDMLKAQEQWMRTRYHTPADDLAQPIDYAAALPLTEFNYRLGLAVANREARPRWKPGDFFGELFGK